MGRKNYILWQQKVTSLFQPNTLQKNSIEIENWGNFWIKYILTYVGAFLAIITTFKWKSAKLFFITCEIQKTAKNTIGFGWTLKVGGVW